MESDGAVLCKPCAVAGRIGGIMRDTLIIGCIAVGVFVLVWFVREVVTGISDGVLTALPLG